MDGLDLDLQCLNESRQPGCLTAWQLEHQPAEGGRVDDRVLERSGQASPEDPGVEGVVAVLDQDRSPSEVEERPPGVAELGGVDEHLALDQVAPLGVGIDRCAGVDEGVEQPQRPAQPEALGADLEDQEGPVAGGLDIDGDELGVLQRRLGIDRGIVVATLARLPGDELGGPPGLEPQGPVRSHVPIVGACLASPPSGEVAAPQRGRRGGLRWARKKEIFACPGLLCPPPPRLRRDSPMNGGARLAFP